MFTSINTSLSGAYDPKYNPYKPKSKNWLGADLTLSDPIADRSASEILNDPFLSNGQKQQILTNKAGILLKSQYEEQNLNRLNELKTQQLEEAAGTAHRQKVGTVSSYAGTIADFGSSLFQGNSKVAGQSNTTHTLNNAYDATSSGLMNSGNPYAMMAGAIMKVAGLGSDALTAAGVGTDLMTSIDKVLDSKWLKLTPIGLTNALGASSTLRFEKDAELEAALGDAYADSYNDIDAAAAHAGKKYGLLSRRSKSKWNTNIANAKLTQDNIESINAANLDATAAGNYEGVGLTNQSILNGGLSMLRAGKEGMKINNIDFARKALRYTAIPDLDLSFLNVLVESFEQGGTIEAIKEPESIEEIIPCDLESLLGDLAQYLKDGGAFNVIPEGALHKNKHHMEDSEGLTQKGIPVVTEEDGKKVQLAEIEVNEVILHLELTQKLEELKKKAEEAESEEEKSNYAIEAGKLLAKELLHNTVDNTGLLKEVQ